MALRDRIADILMRELQNSGRTPWTMADAVIGEMRLDEIFVDSEYVEANAGELNPAYREICDILTEQKASRREQ